MSRHRDVRNLDSDEYHDDADYGSSYGSSYYDEVSLSTSLERQYMYRRNASGTTPKFSHFLARTHSVSSVPEEDEGNDNAFSGRASADADSDDDDSSEHSSFQRPRRHSSESSLLEGLSEEDKSRLAECLEQILDIVGDTMPEIQVKEAVIRCDFNAELTLNTLLNNPIGVFHLPQGPQRLVERERRRLDPRPTPWSPPAVMETPTNIIATKQATGYTEVFSDRSSASALEKKSKDSEDCNSQQNGDVEHSPFATPTCIPKKGHRLKIRSRTPSPAIQTTPHPSGVTSTPGSAVKMRKNKVDPMLLYASQRLESGGDGASESCKDLLNLVVVGHVDSGKSTLMGRILFELGQVSKRLMHKYETESRKVGKASFAYAWVLDETSEERERGITMDVGHSAFETDNKSVILLDAPGHRDFIPNMISGAYQADVAILVVNSTRGEFEAGFDSGGQTREHAILVRSLGVYQLIVAVNKLDTVDWAQKRFVEISEKLGKFLRQVGFKDADITFVPVSGLTGINLIERSECACKDLFSWYDSEKPTLLQAIDAFNSPPRPVEKAFRLSISDIYKPTTGGGGFCASGRIESGFVQKNDNVLVAPLNEVGVVKAVSLDVDSDGVKYQRTGVGFAGDHVSLTITGIDQANVSQGMVLCDPQNPVKVSKHFAAKLIVFSVDDVPPITKGFPCVLHHVGVTEAATIKKLLAHLNKSTGEVTKRKPRILLKNSSAAVEIVTENQICLDTYAESKELGRFMLRASGKTIAAGLVTDILF